MKPEEILVRPVDMAAFSKKIKEAFPGQFGEGEEPDFHYSQAVVFSVSGRAYLINQECCGDDKALMIDVYKKTARTFTGTPIMRIEMSLEEIPLLPEVSLKDFMADRFEYNDRIKGNTARWLRFLFDKEYRRLYYIK